MRKLISCGALLSLVLIAGCANCPPGPGHDIISVPDGMISVQQLAGRLGLTVDVHTPSLVTLRNATNRVTAVPDNGGQISVNGKIIGRPADFIQVRGVLFVPEAMEATVRAALKPLLEPPTPSPATPGTEKPKPAAPPVRRIVVDAGHGGDDAGITGHGLLEKTLTLQVAEELANLLKQRGFEVGMTRQTDEFVDLDNRAAFCSEYQADLLVSIHADSCDAAAARGFTVFTCKSASPESRAAAKAVADSMHKAGLEEMGVQQADYRLLVCTTCTGIIVDAGYLSNSRDAEMLGSVTGQKRVAKAIADGIALYYKK